MADYGAGVADDAIDKTARQLRRIYKKASEELQGKFDDFLRKHQAKGEVMFEKLQNGEITQAAYHSWMRGQVFMGKQWEQKIDQAARIMGSATAEAAEIVNHNRLHVFAENYNFAAYQLEKRAKGAISFNLFNDRSVVRLMKQKPKMLPEWKIDEEKDYKWNRQKVENAVTQGIIQGKKIDDITGDMCQALQTGNENRMRTFARTSMTGAQNAGRLAQMEDAEEQGIKVKKRWIATLDSRTRDTHQELDGQTVPVDEPFEVDGMEIMYPGDPNAEPELVYNCRCTMIEIYEGIDRVSSRRAYDDDENGGRDTANSYVVQDMTYDQWKEWKEAGKPEIVTRPDSLVEDARPSPRKAEFVPAATREEAEEKAREFCADIGGASYKGIDLEYANICNSVLADIDETFDVPGLGHVQAMNMRTTVFRGSTAEAAYKWGGIGGDLFINPTYYKSKAAFAAHKAEIDSLTDVVMKGGRALLDSGKYKGSQREMLEAILNTGRQCVAQSHDFVRGTFVHEMGHRLDDHIVRKALKAAFGSKDFFYQERLAESRKQYGGGISGYAVSSNAEYVAESFAAWWFGEGDKIDPILRRVFEGLVKRK